MFSLVYLDVYCCSFALLLLLVHILFFHVFYWTIRDSSDQSKLSEAISVSPEITRKLQVF